MYKLIATDLDGTLLRSDKTISKETIDLLVRLNDEYGVIFLPSTGRTFRELPKAITALPFLRYALTVNGGGIYDLKLNTYIHEVTIPNTTALQVLEFVKDLPVHPSCVVKGKRMMAGTENDEIDPYIVKVAAKGILPNATGYHNLSQAIQQLGHDVQKMLLYPDDANQRNEIIEKLAIQFPDLSISSSGALFIEVNAKGIDKGVALNKLCQHLNIPIEETIAFGDAENDIPLLDAADYAIVMSNGTEETKKHADEITDSCDNDGLRKSLEKCFKI